MSMGFAPTWLRQLGELPASHDHFNHTLPSRQRHRMSEDAVINFDVMRQPVDIRMSWLN